MNNAFHAVDSQVVQRTDERGLILISVGIGMRVATRRWGPPDVWRFESFMKDEVGSPLR